ncbi:hypothetical protein, partial [Pseudomonas syringae group genomosp. 7]|uniref:hypothetical protein n=1 Tax=Pseudomonas syringae group genomosp. 7 TaxID=251699 RepID=UPI00376FBCC3
YSARVTFTIGGQNPEKGPDIVLIDPLNAVHFELCCLGVLPARCGVARTVTEYQAALRTREQNIIFH